MANKEKILVVDDSREMLLVMKHLLLNNGYQPLLAENGLVGLKYGAGTQSRPDRAGLKHAHCGWLANVRTNS
jgi:CheY-like chemotaxis protein